MYCSNSEMEIISLFFPDNMAGVVRLAAGCPATSNKLKKDQIFSRLLSAQYCATTNYQQGKLTQTTGGLMINITIIILARFYFS